MIKVTLKTSDLRRTIIIDESTESPRSAFASQGVTDLGGKQLSISGTPITGSKVDATFASLGYAADSEINLSAVVKGDGAASFSAKIVKDLRKAILYSGIAEKDYNLVSKASPVTLQVIKTVNGNEEPVFGVSYKKGNGSISKFGVEFGSVSSNGYLMVTFDLPGSAKTDAEMKAYVAEKILPATLNLGTVEDAVILKAAEIRAAQDALARDIEIG